MKFKIFLSLFLFQAISALAQTPEEIRDYIWGTNDEYKKATTIPDKWKNESAVILHKREHYNLFLLFCEQSWIAGWN